MLTLFHTENRQIFIGNILFIICCGFYLAWWLLAFRPSGADTGVKTGWLLIPASLAGLSGIVLIVRCVLTETFFKQLLPGEYILWGGIAAFIILLVVTALVFKRPVTTELILIVGWGMLALAEINTLFGSELFSYRMAVGFVVLIGAVVVFSMICYVLYFQLNSRAGYIAGMIPLLLTALTMASISCFMVIFSN